MYCSLLLAPSDFVDLAAILEQAALGTAPLDIAWADLLAARLGNGSFNKHAERFRALANLAAAPENALPQLFRASIPQQSQSDTAR